MSKFEAGKKYAIYSAKGPDQKIVGSIEVLNRTPKFITYHDDFFGRTKKQKIEIKDNKETIFAFYCGVNASDLIQ